MGAGGHRQRDDLKDTVAGKAHDIQTNTNDLADDGARNYSDAPFVSVVVPVYNERDNIQSFLAGVRDHVHSDAEIVIVYDFDEDNTLPAVREMADPPGGIRLVKNTLGRGVVNALRAGLKAARGQAVIVTMADCSDEPSDIDRLAERIRGGADVVAGSRYMPGGRQIGGPLLKRTLSRLAGKSLYTIAGMPIRDATNSFRAYSRRVVDEIEIESTGGFEIGIELTVKAWCRGWRLEEIPTTWRDRTAGEARFRLWQWLPRYLRWYMRGLSHGLL